MRALLSIATCLLLSGCTPAVYLNIYNATDATLTVVKPQFRHTLAIIIPPHEAADLPLTYQPGTRVVIRDSRHTWTYSPRSLFPPHSAYQEHTITMRAFSKIDSRGRVYLLAPPSDHGAPKEISQPAGFPVIPEKT
jgi:hypothetical protein